MATKKRKEKERKLIPEKNEKKGEVEIQEKRSEDTGELEQGTSAEGIPVAVIGIGASAGGLEALEQFFSNIPSNTNLAFVVIQHQDPKYKGLLAEIIQRYTEMSVLEVNEDTPLQPNTVYIKPSRADLTLINHVLTLTESKEIQGIRTPIDMFFRSLAEDQDGKAVGILLSGMGSDGTLGIRALKEKTGMVMAQEPSDSKFGVMPQNAIATGLVDYIASAEELPRLLMEYIKHLTTLPERRIPDSSLENSLSKIFIMIRARNGLDFSMYKRSTIRRRIERRMGLHQLSAIEHYVQYLRENPTEVDVLSKELLIGVTRFFRDPDAWQQLKEYLMMMVKSRSTREPIRAWVVGCSTGEEAYSLAMVLRECIDMLNRAGDLRFQIFATDVDNELIEYARHAQYPPNIAQDVSPERLERFFVREDENYRIRSELRETVVFARQNVIMDPPFTHLDILSCRNLLIYLSPEIQNKLIPLFHYSLSPGGILFLGSAETIGQYSNLFKGLIPQWKVFERRDIMFPEIAEIDIPAMSSRHAQPLDQITILPREQNLTEVIKDWLINQFVPPSVIVNEDGDILYFQGKTAPYLQPPGGKASLSIYAMAREGLQYALTMALRNASREKREVTVDDVTIATNGSTQNIRLIVKPIIRASGRSDLFNVVFEDKKPTIPEISKEEASGEVQAPRNAHQLEMEQELTRTKERLQHIVEENQASQEELKSMNEELQSTNEELQSTNEELTTSKEELQSLNEELLTVNAELQTKLEELSKSNDDMRNLLRSTDIPMLFLDNELRVRRYTDPVKKVINLISSDIGRPITDLVINLKGTDLAKEVRDVLDSLVYLEKPVETTDGRRFLMRIIPYRTLDNRIDGVVMTFLDTTEAAKLLTYAENIINTVREPLLVLTEDFHVVSANESFYETFHVTREETEQNKLFDLGDHQWDIPELHHLLEDILPSNTTFEDFRVEHDFPGIGHRVMSLNARKIHSGREPELILLAIEDIKGEQSEKNQESETKGN